MAQNDTTSQTKGPEGQLDSANSEILYQYEERVRPGAIFGLVTFSALWFGFLGYALFFREDGITLGFALPFSVFTLFYVAIVYFMVGCIIRGGTNSIEINRDLVRWQGAFAPARTIRYADVESFKLNKKVDGSPLELQLKSGEWVRVAPFGHQRKVVDILLSILTSTTASGINDVAVGSWNSTNSLMQPDDGSMTVGNQPRPNWIQRVLSPRTIVIFGGISMLVGAAWSAYTAVFVFRASQAPGTVLHVESDSDGGAHQATFAFSDADGNPYTCVTEFRSLTRWSPIQAGDQVNVLYDASAPLAAKIDSFATLWFESLMVVLGGLVTSGFGWIFGWFRKSIEPYRIDDSRS